jgi:hypothetical protein
VKEYDQPPTDANLEAKNYAVAIEVLGGEKLGLGLEEQTKALVKTGENGAASVGSAVEPVSSSSEHSSSFLLQKMLFLAHLELDSPHQLSHLGAHRHQQAFLLSVLPLGQG